MRVLVSSCVFLVVVALSIPGLAKKKDEPLSTVNFVVLRDESGKPVRNAAVVIHPVNEDGKQRRGGIELKTDPEGKTSYEGIPYGKMRIQVLAPGFQTYGDDYQINRPTVDITVKMKRPARQYSIYEEHGEQQKPPAEEKKPQ
jgi:hypothetical protein